MDLSLRDLCINMNNHQNAIFHQITNFLKTPLALLGVDLKNFQFNKICHFANHPYLCKGLFNSIAFSFIWICGEAIATAPFPPKNSSHTGYFSKDKIMLINFNQAVWV